MLGLSNLGVAQALSKEAAVRLAEKFLADNGYSNLPPDKTKASLDMESIEWAVLDRARSADTRSRILEMRFNSLRPKAIGIRRGTDHGRELWYIAFDYTRASDRDFCRVVTMTLDGSQIRMEHKSGDRKYLVGFDER
jgi:hypothetical protein